MPAGPGILGFIYFGATKLIGYSAFAAYVINKSKPVRNEPEIRPPSALTAGAVRTAIGIAVGAIVGLSFWKLPNVNADRLFDSGMFFALLVPVRVGEWWALLRTVYRRYSFDGTNGKIIGFGIVCSFALDFIGLICAWVLPGGMWVC